MKHRRIRIIAAAVLSCILPLQSIQAAENVHVVLTANGTAVAGDGPNGVIQAFGFDNEVVVERDSASGVSTGRRLYKPIRIVKAIDKSTPLLAKALAQNQVITAEFRLRRPSADNSTVATYYTVSITGARVAGIRDWKTNTRDLSADRAGDLEEVSFIFTSITFTWVDGGVTFTDTVSSP